MDRISEKDDPSWGSNHTPSTIRADVLSQLGIHERCSPDICSRDTCSPGPDLTPIKAKTHSMSCPHPHILLHPHLRPHPHSHLRLHPHLSGEHLSGYHLKNLRYFKAWRNHPTLLKHLITQS
jgi:hypothetical protein